MRKTVRDTVATVCVAAVVVPYIGYLIWDELPFIKDPRGMSAIALVLGVIAFLVAGMPATATGLGRTEWAIAVATLALGVVSLALAETAAAEALLATFIAAIVVVWTVEALDHFGLIRPHAGSPFPH